LEEKEEVISQLIDYSLTSDKLLSAAWCGDPEILKEEVVKFF